MRGSGFLFRHVITDHTAEHARNVEKKKLELEKALKGERLHKLATRAEEMKADILRRSRGV